MVRLVDTCEPSRHSLSKNVFNRKKIKGTLGDGRTPEALPRHLKKIKVLLQEQTKIA